jgi:hypothetical protein
MPIRGIRSDRCALAANGHAAAPPMNVRHSRRLNRLNCIRSPSRAFRNIIYWWGSRHGSVAVRHFGPAKDRNGSKARITAPQHWCPLLLNERISAAMNRGSRSCQERTCAAQQTVCDCTSSINSSVSIWSELGTSMPSPARPADQRTRARFGSISAVASTWASGWTLLR